MHFSTLTGDSGKSLPSSNSNSNKHDNDWMEKARLAVSRVHRKKSTSSHVTHQTKPNTNLDVSKAEMVAQAKVATNWKRSNRRLVITMNGSKLKANDIDTYCVLSVNRLPSYENSSGKYSSARVKKKTQVTHKSSTPDWGKPMLEFVFRDEHWTKKAYTHTSTVRNSVSPSGSRNTSGSYEYSSVSQATSHNESRCSYEANSAMTSRRSSITSAAKKIRRISVILGTAGGLLGGDGFVGVGESLHESGGKGESGNRGNEKENFDVSAADGAGRSRMDIQGFCVDVYRRHKRHRGELIGTCMIPAAFLKMGLETHTLAIPLRTPTSAHDGEMHEWNNANTPISLASYCSYCGDSVKQSDSEECINCKHHIHKRCKLLLDGKRNMNGNSYANSPVNMCGDYAGVVNIEYSYRELVVLPLSHYRSLLEFLLDEDNMTSLAHLAEKASPQKRQTLLESLISVLAFSSSSPGDTNYVVRFLIYLSQRLLQSEKVTPSTIFRSNSVMSKCTTIYLHRIGKPYLHATLCKVIRRMLVSTSLNQKNTKDTLIRHDTEESLKIDIENGHAPSSPQQILFDGGFDGQDIEQSRAFAYTDTDTHPTAYTNTPIHEHTEVLRYWSRMTLDAIMTSGPYLPMELKVLLMNVRRDVQSRFSNKTTSEAKNASHSALCGFVVLRFIVPALLNPEKAGLADGQWPTSGGNISGGSKDTVMSGSVSSPGQTSGGACVSTYTSPSSSGSRTSKTQAQQQGIDIGACVSGFETINPLCVVVGRVVQAVANQTVFKSEDKLCALNNTVSEYIPHMREFVEGLCMDAEVTESTPVRMPSADIGVDGSVAISRGVQSKSSLVSIPSSHSQRKGRLQSGIRLSTHSTSSETSSISSGMFCAEGAVNKSKYDSTSSLDTTPVCTASPTRSPKPSRVTTPTRSRLSYINAMPTNLYTSSSSCGAGHDGNLGSTKNMKDKRKGISSSPCGRRSPGLQCKELGSESDSPLLNKRSTDEDGYEAADVGENQYLSLGRTQGNSKQKKFLKKAMSMIDLGAPSHAPPSPNWHARALTPTLELTCSCEHPTLLAELNAYLPVPTGYDIGDGIAETHRDDIPLWERQYDYHISKELSIVALHLIDAHKFTSQTNTSRSTPKHTELKDNIGALLSDYETMLISTEPTNLAKSYLSKYIEENIPSDTESMASLSAVGNP
eukprot:CFRG3215T1